MSKKNVAVVMGGFSDEYKVSLKSGQLIFDSLDRDLYHVYKVVILKEGWYFLDENEERIELNKGDFSVNLKNGEILKFDVCFNIIHGTPGENGILQAYWDAVGQKYTGCDFYQSALTINKKDTLAVLSKYGIPSAKSVYLRKGDPIDEEKIISELKLPLFVKPNQSGSSLGISKVKEISELATAIEFAFKEDDEILIESFLDGMEVSVGVLDYQGETIVLGITEIIPEKEFFDYEAKYDAKMSDEIIPGRFSAEITGRIQDMASEVYDILRCEGIVRIDGFVVPDGGGMDDRVVVDFSDCCAIVFAGMADAHGNPQACSL